jgi:hypothetical protein
MANGREQKIWGRRMISASLWFFCNIGLIALQPHFKLDSELLKIFLEKSAWISGIIIAGITATDSLVQWAGTKTPCPPAVPEPDTVSPPPGG